MTIKTWAAADVTLGKLTIHQVRDEDGRSAIQLERRYRFLDEQGETLAQIAGGRVLETIAIIDIPQGILSALLEIDAWTKQKALAQEGMAD